MCDRTNKINKLQEDIDELEKQIKQLKLEQSVFNTLKPEYKLAEKLHKKMCSWNHTDGCGWYYEPWDKLRHAKQTYVDKARKVLDKVDYETACLVVDNM